jgi:hypothetical protein
MPTVFKLPCPTQTSEACRRKRCRASTRTYSPFLHLCVLAIASHIADERGLDSDWQSAMLDRVSASLELELERPRLSTVTGLVLLYACLADSGRTNVSWIYNGQCTVAYLGDSCEVRLRLDPMLRQVSPVSFVRRWA